MFSISQKLKKIKNLFVTKQPPHYSEESKIKQSVISNIESDNYTETELYELEAELNLKNEELYEARHRIEVVNAWFDEFDDLTDWMRKQGFWDAQDIDSNNPMNTYKKGLQRFLAEHGIEKEKEIYEQNK